MRWAWAGVLVGIAWAFPAVAADHDNLEEGLPVQVEDAHPIAFRGRELQSSFQYERRNERGAEKNAWVLQPRLEVGLAPNFQAKVSAPFVWGTADHGGSRNLRLEGLYNFNQETTVLPAFALAAGADFPTGVRSAGVDPILKVVLTKTLGPWNPMPRLHLNGAWLRNAGPRKDERRDRYRAIVGYSMRVTPDMLLVADFVRELGVAKSAESNVAEVGFRLQLTPLTVLVLGAGVGIGAESPDARVTVGFQHSLALASWR